MKNMSRIFFLIIIVCSVTAQMYAQNKALLLIDIQDFYFSGGDVPLDNPKAAALNAGLLLEQFRKSGDLVIHVRHNYEPGGEIHQYVSPSSQEIVISKDHVNAFRNTDLDLILKEHEVSDLFICGMQTHMCLEAAVRAASDLEYNVAVVGDACATRALQFGETIVAADDVHHSTLATLKSYARIIKVTDYLIESAGESGRQ